MGAGAELKNTPIHFVQRVALGRLPSCRNQAKTTMVSGAAPGLGCSYQAILPNQHEEIKAPGRYQLPLTGPHASGTQKVPSEHN